MVRHLALAAGWSRMAMASAAPSVGSVPAPSSSKSTRSLAVRLVEDLHDVGHMGGEGAQATAQCSARRRCRRYTRPKTLSSVPSSAGTCRPALRHEGEQAHRLEGHRLAAGVGAGDDERGKFIAQPQIAGHHLVRINKRMTTAHDLQVSARVHLGQAGAHLPCREAPWRRQSPDASAARCW